MPEFDLFDDREPRVSCEVVSSGFEQAPGFFRLKEARMRLDEMTPQQIAAQMEAQKLSEVMPILDGEIAKMIETATSAMMTDVRKGTLTPELAVNYCMEIYSYHRLNKRLLDKVAASNRD